MTVGDLSRRMGSRELSTWLALYELEAEERQHKELDKRAEQGSRQRLDQLKR
jgi:hypothetical protein